MDKGRYRDMNHIEPLRKYDENGKKWNVELPRSWPRGSRIIFKPEGYIADDVVWSAWNCMLDEITYCHECQRDWETLIEQVRSGALKCWPRTFKYVPEKYRAEFTRAFLEGKIKGS